ncbi:MAG: Membrane fusion protein multidrug efflux system [Rhodospirillales bacterium]|jgi:multidrug efflux system membrane fusion protein|nr:Membrane fusion protein multidrug efflux system [Rhodospirillales bacterium]
MRKIGALALGLVGLGSCLGLWYVTSPSPPAHAAPPGASAAIPVTAGRAEAKDVPVFLMGLGTVQAFNSVTVKSRVDGPIVKVSFAEGQEVKAGDALFQIDPRPFQAMLEQAQGNKAKDEAQLAGAQRDLARYAKLLPQGYQTGQSYDDQKATVGQLQGTVAADQAAIDTAQLNLDYANIRSPIDGRTGARLVDVGNLVQAGNGAALVTIAQLKPIFVSFTVPQASLIDIRSSEADGKLAVVVEGQDAATPLATGQLTLIDNQIDGTTGTIHLKATFDNADEKLWPGEFVNVRLITSHSKNAITVPAQTVMQGPNGAYAYVIKPDNTVERRVVEMASSNDGTAVITKGIAAGETVVVDGQYRLTDGARVNPAAPGSAPSS